MRLINLILLCNVKKKHSEANTFKKSLKLVQNTYGLLKKYCATTFFYQNTEKLSIPWDIPQYALWDIFRSIPHGVPRWISRAVSRDIPQGIPRGIFWGVPRSPFPVQGFKDSH